MKTQQQNQPGNTRAQQNAFSSSPLENDAVEADATPVLDEEDLEENGLTEEEAEDIEWDEQDDLVAKAAAEEGEADVTEDADLEEDDLDEEDFDVDEDDEDNEEESTM